MTYPADWTVGRALEAYFEENGWSAATYDETTTKAKAFGITFAFPNTPRHRIAIMMHDLHHCATGYGTDLAGEGEISAWELRRGLRPLGLYVGGIVLLGTLTGILFAPRRTWRAWRASDGDRSLFHADFSEYESLLSMSVGELRERLGIPQDGLARERGLHQAAPAG